ncbi:MAG: hypothetical protein MUF71_10340 [Candidatus Kapabacteria bacterium]|jgi:hypothetical protein|nr:hypothetical protein [Candidatus Kapabacteria bacterium]
MAASSINFHLPEFVQQIQALAKEQKKKGNAASFVRISDETKEWVWQEGYRTASEDIQQSMKSASLESLNNIIGLKITIDNSLRPFQFIIG